jgi:hypothetical protein
VGVRPVAGGQLFQRDPAFRIRRGVDDHPGAWNDADSEARGRDAVAVIGGIFAAIHVRSRAE